MVSLVVRRKRKQKHREFFLFKELWKQKAIFSLLLEFSGEHIYRLEYALNVSCSFKDFKTSK